jgi:hypothetical protein
MLRFVTPALALALVGCTTSAQDVVFETPGTEGEDVSLQVAWAAMEGRLNAIQADLARTQADIESLCELPGASSRAICRRVAGLETTTSNNSAEITAIDPELQQLTTRLEATEATLAPVQYDARNSAWIVSGVNLHVRNTSGTTDGDSDGTGNLIVGWNEAGEDDERTGSHNLIVGSGHNWESHSGVVSGTDHMLTSVGAAALGGEGNTVTAEGAVAIGGQDNVASGLLTVTLGGTDNVADGELALTAGGSGNDAAGTLSVALGGVDGRVVDEGLVLLGPVHGPDLPVD